jgi:hypothetical protein
MQVGHKRRYETCTPLETALAGLSPFTRFPCRVNISSYWLGRGRLESRPGLQLASLSKAIQSSLNAQL